MPRGSDGLTGAALVFTAGLYALGLVIANLSSTAIGVPELEGVRPRYLLVGGMFLLVQASPIAVLALPRIVASSHPAWFEGRWRTIGVTLLVLASGTAMAALILFPAFTPLSQEQPGFRWHGRFHVLTGIEALLVWLPASVLIYRPRRLASPRRRRATLCVLVLGVGASLYPYAMLTYPNMVRGLGGANPRLVDLYFTDSLDLFIPDRLAGKTMRWRSALLWDERDREYVVSDGVASSETFRATLIARDKVSHVVVVPSTTTFIGVPRVSDDMWMIWIDIHINVSEWYVPAPFIPDGVPYRSP